MDEVGSKRRACRLEPRQQLVSDEVAKVLRVEVRAVLPPGEPLLLEPCHEIGARPPKKWSYDRSGVFDDTGQRPRPTAAQQLNQDAFGHVVTVVAGGDRLTSGGTGEIEQDSVAEAPPGRFTPEDRRLMRIDFQQVERNIEVGAKGRAELRIAVCFVATDAVVYVCGLEIQREFRAAQKVKQSDRVGSSGEGDEDPPCDQMGKDGPEVLEKIDREHAPS